MLEIEFEDKGIDIWWRMIYTNNDGVVFVVGTGITPSIDWLSFAGKFSDDVKFIERR